MNPQQYLSPHFTLDDLTRSQTAVRQGISNLPGGREMLELERLCKTMLEPLFELVLADDPLARVPNSRLEVSSGYRCPSLNAAIGSKATSQHVLGRAADLVVRGMSPLRLCNLVIANRLPFDQLIFEGRWTHVSIAGLGEKPRGNVLTAHFGPRGTTYTAGLPS